MIRCPKCQSRLKENVLSSDFTCPTCATKLKSNRKRLVIPMEIAAALGGILLIGWVYKSNYWYLVAAIVYELAVYGLYRSFLRVERAD